MQSTRELARPTIGTVFTDSPVALALVVAFIAGVVGVMVWLRRRRRR